MLKKNKNTILPYLLSDVKVERVDKVALSKLGSTSAQDQNECIDVIKVSPFWLQGFDKYS